MLFLDEEPTRRRPGKAEQEILYKAQNGRCMYCGIKLGQRYMEPDHKVPVARGGSDRLSNLHMVCHPCNSRKGTLTDGEYRQRYKLTPARQAKAPPRKVIPQEHFDEITKKRAKRRRREAEGQS